MTTSSWHHQNFVMEYDCEEIVEWKNPMQTELDL